MLQKEKIKIMLMRVVTFCSSTRYITERERERDDLLRYKAGFTGWIENEDGVGLGQVRFRNWIIARILEVEGRGRGRVLWLVRGTEREGIGHVTFNTPTCLLFVENGAHLPMFRIRVPRRLVWHHVRFFLVLSWF